MPQCTHKAIDALKPICFYYLIPTELAQKYAQESVTEKDKIFKVCSISRVTAMKCD